MIQGKERATLSSPFIYNNGECEQVCQCSPKATMAAMNMRSAMYRYEGDVR